MARLYSGTATVTVRFWDIEADSAHEAVLEAISEDLGEYGILNVDATFEEDDE